LAKTKNVKEFKYPSKVTSSGALKGWWQTAKVSMIFHLLMTILLVSGLVIDLLGVFLGGLLSPIRSIVHGYLGTALVIVLPIYFIQVIVTRKTRMLMTAANYVNFVLYFLLILTGITIASVNQVWVDTLPWLSTSLSGFSSYAPAIHTVSTYVWLLFSTFSPGGFLHGIAVSYLISIQKDDKNTVER
jgi:hypothetical protein